MSPGLDRAREANTPCGAAQALAVQPHMHIPTFLAPRGSTLLGAPLLLALKRRQHLLSRFSPHALKPGWPA